MNLTYSLDLNNNNNIMETNKILYNDNGKYNYNNDSDKIKKLITTWIMIISLTMLNITILKILIII